MSTFKECATGVYRWDGVDADHGFPITGYLLIHSGDCLLVDPPATSGEAQEIQAIGRPEAILLTSQWHVRGAGLWKERFSIPILAPASAADELAEAETSADTTLDDGDEYLGWQVLRLSTQQGDQAFDELAYWHKERRTLILGDLITADEDGSLHFGPSRFMGVPISKLRPIVERMRALNPKLLLSAHIGPRSDAMQVLEALATA